MQQRLNVFLNARNLVCIEKISKGYSSKVFLVESPRKKKFALKIEKDSSPRKNMVQKEVSCLRKANKVGIGPKLCGFDLQNKCILLEFIKGKTLQDFVFSSPSKKQLEIVLKKLFLQAKELDEINLSHGQLGGKMKNILISKNKPIIIDFEKASLKRKTRNLSQLKGSLLYSKHSALSKKVNSILGNSKKLVERI